MGAIQLGLTIIIVAILAKFATGFFAFLAGALFIPALVVGIAAIVVGFATGNKALGGRDKNFLP